MRKIKIHKYCRLHATEHNPSITHSVREHAKEVIYGVLVTDSS